MAALNVRNVTLEQMASWKTAAAAEGKTLREWVLEQLGRKTVYVSRENPPEAEEVLAAVERQEAFFSPKPKTIGHHPRCKCSLCAA